MTKLLIISLMFMRFMKLKVTILTRLQIKIRPKGLHKSLTPDPWPLTPVLSTTVERALQTRPFMQNEPKFRKSQVNVSDLFTREYRQMDTWSIGKNEPKLKKAKMNVTSITTNDYVNKLPIRAPKKQSQFSKRQKSIQTLLPQRIMKKTRFRVPTKQTQFYRCVASSEAGTNPISKRRKITCFGTNYFYNHWFGINIGDFYV